LTLAVEIEQFTIEFSPVLTLKPVRESPCPTATLVFLMPIFHFTASNKCLQNAYKRMGKRAHKKEQEELWMARERGVSEQCGVRDRKPERERNMLN